jgi:competence ComEA-like helix-hairpin-helix protein
MFAQRPGQFPPDGPGKDLFENVCSLCHASGAVAGKQWRRDDWDAKVTEMLQEEPDVTSRERAAIVDYLAAHFRPGGPIYINYATAKDLAALLEIQAKDAETVVRRREEQGAFTAAEDLLGIPGLASEAAAKMNATRDRLDFSRDE